MRDLTASIVLLACMLLPVSALTSEFSANDPFAPQAQEPLPPDEAFVFSHALVGDGNLLLRWQMPDDHYLYKHRFQFKLRDGSQLTLGDARIPAGKPKIDDWEGEVEVYYHEVEVHLPVTGNGEVGIGYQGCNEALGICYPPELKWVSVGEPAPAEGAVEVSADDSFTGVLADSGVMMSMGLFLLAGIGLAFTPCVLPMVPILSGIIVGEGATISRRKAFTLSVAYVLGMAIAYAVVGTLVGLFGAELNLQAKLQSPPVLTVFALAFVALAFSMFGFYELQLPSGLQNRLNDLGSRAGGGKLLSVFVMGALSSLVVSPCVSAPLTGALVYISQTEDALLGGMALLSLGLGMGVPLLLVGAGGGHLLPRAGVWMDTVKAVFGVLLLAVAVWLIERIIPASLTLALWGALLIGAGVYMGGLDTAPRQGWGQLWKAFGFIFLVYGVLLFIGAASGAKDPLRPLAAVGREAGASISSEAHQVWAAVGSRAELDAALASAGGRPAILDLYADWCVSCKVMERNVFPQPQIASRFERFALLRADITANDRVHKALLDSFGLFGPPALLFFADDGAERRAFRVQGEMDEAELAAHIDRFLASI